MNRPLTTLAWLLTACCVSSANAEPYTYEQPLDIAKVIKLEVPSTSRCKVVMATMVYEDSAGERKTLNYERLAESCTRADE